MSANERCILIDADVVSHFITAGEMLSLPRIFPYPILILDKVYAELSLFPGRKAEVKNLLRFGLLREMPFPETNPEIRREYARIKGEMFKGDGEAACMAVVRYSRDILASSNLRDVRDYCNDHGIDLLTTMDFLCVAWRSGFFDLARCNTFIQKVLAAKRKLPDSRMEDYTCR